MRSFYLVFMTLIICGLNPVLAGQGIIVKGIAWNDGHRNSDLILKVANPTRTVVAGFAFKMECDGLSKPVQFRWVNPAIPLQPGEERIMSGPVMPDSSDVLLRDTSDVSPTLRFSQKISLGDTIVLLGDDAKNVNEQTMSNFIGDVLLYKNIKSGISFSELSQKLHNSKETRGAIQNYLKYEFNHVIRRWNIDGNSVAFIFADRDRLVNAPDYMKYVESPNNKLFAVEILFPANIEGIAVLGSLEKKYGKFTETQVVEKTIPMFDPENNYPCIIKSILNVKYSGFKFENDQVVIYFIDKVVPLEVSISPISNQFEVVQYRNLGQYRKEIMLSAKDSDSFVNELKKIKRSNVLVSLNKGICPVLVFVSRSLSEPFVQ